MLFRKPPNRTLQERFRWGTRLNREKMILHYLGGPSSTTLPSPSTSAKQEFGIGSSVPWQRPKPSAEGLLPRVIFEGTAITVSVRTKWKALYWSPDNQQVDNQ